MYLYQLERAISETINNPKLDNESLNKLAGLFLELSHYKQAFSNKYLFYCLEQYKPLADKNRFRNRINKALSFIKFKTENIEHTTFYKLN